MGAPTDRPDDPNLGARGEWLARVSEAASGLAASHTPEQPRGSSSGSTITVSYTSLPPSRDKSLDPTFLFAPPSQLRSRSKLAVCGGLMAIISSVVITAAIATGEFQPADIWRQLGLHPTTELASWLSRPAQLNSEQAIPRLIVQSSRVSSGEPMPLGVALRGRAEGAVVIIKGLVPGMELSAGNAVGTDAWQLPATDLGDAWIAPPEGFVGSTHLVAELRLSDEKMADQQMIQIDWVSAIAAPAGTHGQFQEIAARPLILPPPTDRQPEKASAGSSIPPPQAERPPEEITAGPWISPPPMRNPGKIAAEGQRRRDVFWQLVEAAAGSPISPPPVESHPEQIAVESPISPLPTQFQPQVIAAEPPISPPLTDRQLAEAAAGPPISPSPTQFQPQVIAAEPPTSPPLTDRQLAEAAAGPPISPSPTQLQPQVIAAEPPISAAHRPATSRGRGRATDLAIAYAAPTTSDRGGATYLSAAHRPATSRGRGRATDLAIAYAAPTTSDRGGATYLSAAHRPATSRGRGRATDLAIAYAAPTTSDRGGATDLSAAHRPATRRGHGRATDLAIAYAAPTTSDRGGATYLSAAHRPATSRGRGRATDLATTYAVPTTNDRGGATDRTATRTAQT